MAQYKLLAGLHVQADETAEPVGTLQDPRTGKETPVYPSRTYKAGDMVDTDVDLVDKFGPEKFLLVGEAEQARQRRGTGSHTRGDPAPEIVRKDPATFPDGQVSTGWQQAKTGVNPADDPNPEVQSHGLDEGAAKEIQGKHAEEGEAQAKDDEKATKAHKPPTTHAPHKAPHHKK